MIIIYLTNVLTVVLEVVAVAAFVILSKNIYLGVKNFILKTKKFHNLKILTGRVFKLTAVVNFLGLCLVL
jgi:hypothetical protein